MVFYFRGNASSPDVQQNSSQSIQADELKQLKSPKKSKFSGLIDWLNRKKMKKSTKMKESKYSDEVDGEESTTIDYVRVQTSPSKSVRMKEKADREAATGTAGKIAAVHWSPSLEEKMIVGTPQKVDISGLSGSPISPIDNDDIEICCSPTCCIEDEIDIEIVECSSPTCFVDDSFATVATSLSPWSSDGSWNLNFFQEDDLCKS